MNDDDSGINMGEPMVRLVDHSKVVAELAALKLDLIAMTNARDEYAKGFSTQNKLHSDIAFECDALKLEVAKKALVRIRDYPFHSEMIGSCMNMADIAKEALSQLNESKL